MSKGSRSIGVGVAVAVSAVMIGCGGGEESTSTSADVSKEDYAQSVRDRCEQFQQDSSEAEKPLNEVFGKVADPADLDADELAAAADDVANLNDQTRQVLEDLEALPRPEGDTEQLDAFFANAEDAQSALDDADAAAEEGDGAALGAAYGDLDQALDTEPGFDAEFGFEACS